ncbi:Bestrophin [Ancylostoma duodenale]|uniref:Bestrophin homolog n=1 Tax=Ancylostoma duodenale TaxID=51022 RepID=A0A0C2D271_9BILA|nr:Bestrophin [Ancylostoma duodenale]
MLAFFVNIIADRWRKIFNNMGWIENCALSLNAVLKSETNDAEARLMRRSIIRYLVLSQILTFRDISMRVRRRFPDLSTIVSSGLMMDHELQMLEKVEVAIFNKYWVPVNWALTILSQAYRKKYVDNAPCLNMMIKEINGFRNGLAVLCNYDWVPIPIAYPQVVFLAVRCYFILCLVCRQYLVGDGAPKHAPVAEALLNPLGEDDDDFECNFLIDRNIAIGMAIVDQTSDKFPTMKMDVLSDRDLMYMNFEKYDEGFLPILLKHGADKDLVCLIYSFEEIEREWGRQGENEIVLLES